MSAGRAIDLLQQAAENNRLDPIRSAQMLYFPSVGELLVTGDLHNHRRNFERIVKAAALDMFPRRHVLLQELIHGGALGPDGEDTSLDLLLDAVEWSVKFPRQVHFLLANHDWAQIFGMAILKEGYDLTERFSRAFTVRFGGRADAVREAFRRFVLSMPLAGITVTGIFLSHSLPTWRDLGDFDSTILRRPLVESDYLRNGPVYKLLWGRSQTENSLDKLSKMWFSELFICGHQQQDKGWGVLAKRMFIVDSSHNHGVMLPLDLSRQHTIDDFKKAIMPLAAIA